MGRVRMWTEDQMAHRRTWQREYAKTHPRASKSRRYVRRSPLRAKTIIARRLTKEEIRIGREVFPPLPYQRPLTRAECEDGPRPCPYVSCKYSLYLDVNPETGSIKLNFPHLEPWELAESCALDVAERGGLTLEELGALINLTRERCRQVEVRATAKLRQLGALPHPRGED